MMNKEILEYRKKHPKCKWCKWYKWHSLEQCAWITCYGTCELKDKIINFDSMLRLCKYYKVKGEEKDDYEKDIKMNIR